MNEFIPKGYEKENGEKVESIVNDETGRFFFLTNRKFENDINQTFSNLPSLAIEKLKKERGENEPITILDVGAGIDAKSAGQIAEKYGNEKDERVRVFGVDLTARKNEQGGLNQIIGDALQLPLQDNSVDIAYSRMALSLIAEMDPDNLEKGLSEVARTLKQGGVFFVDKTLSEKMEKSVDVEKFQKLGEELGVVFYTKETGLFFGTFEKLLKKMKNEYPDWKFLIMAKKPINEDLMKALSLNDKDTV